MITGTRQGRAAFRLVIDTIAAITMTWKARIGADQELVPLDPASRLRIMSHPA